MRYWGSLVVSAMILVAGIIHGVSGAQLPGEEPIEESWFPEIPPALAGPYIVDPAILSGFDAPGTDCTAPEHRLKFACLMYRDGRSGMKKEELASNPFKNLEVFSEVTDTIRADLLSIAKHPEFGGRKVASLSPEFLTYDGAGIELVGVVNRMDRQFNRDIVPEHGKPLACGEISAIYRFGYKGQLATDTPGERRYGSRLPVTMNVVFAAKSWSGGANCRDIAARWLAYTDAMASRASVAVMRNKAMAAISSLTPTDIDRIELNMQGSRVPASQDDASKKYPKGDPPGTDFGTQATYIMRVFRWERVDRTAGHWHTSYLTNQIDRARLFGIAGGDENSCKDKTNVRINSADLAGYLFSMENPKKGQRARNALGDVDNGILNIPQKFLACRAVSVSPGGASRSGNQPFWNDPNPRTVIVTDAQIDAALAQYRRRYPRALKFVANADDFRVRLNDASCSGCHQSRAIAGFHFPGADVAGTSPVNSVYLPGSPHFFGDQARRVDILRKLARGDDVRGRALATSYAMRPFDRFLELAPDQAVGAGQRIQLIGGWGGACMIPQQPDSARKWGCAADLKCQLVFKSTNQPNIGVCLNPAARRQLGDAMQFGEVRTSSFGFDRYYRTSPAFGPLTPNGLRNTTITTPWLTATDKERWLAAHQEFNKGYAEVGAETLLDRAIRIRDQDTGGFPGGSLRLSQCTDLPGEATCGLLAASGFSDCLGQVSNGLRTPESCFRSYTNYAGVRACDPANPCRDDYICLAPAHYTVGNHKQRMAERARARDAEAKAHPELAWAMKQNYFGELGPDQKWLDRNEGRGDRRGVCIPPYFVLQFKADGHVVPKQP